MHYVKDAIARTDVPETLVDLIKQRRRWLNGSFFAGVFAITNFHRVWRESSHSIPRKIVFTFQFLYLTIQNLLSWFLLSNLFLTFFFVLTVTLFEDSKAALDVILATYLILAGGIIIFALGNKPEKRTAVWYLVCSLFYGVVMIGVTGISVTSLVTDGDVQDPREDLPSCSVSDQEIQFGVATALGLIFASAILHGEFGIFLSTLQYFTMLPTFVNILGIFAYSNLHDLSWGTKGLESGGHGPAVKGKMGVKDVVEMKKREEAARQRALAEKEDVDNSFRVFRSALLLTWLATNGLWLYAATNFISSSCYLRYLSFVVAGFNIIRFTGCVIFIFFRLCRRMGINLSKSAGTGGTYSATLPNQWQQHYATQSREARKDIQEENKSHAVVVNTPTRGMNSAAPYSNMPEGGSTTASL